MKTVLINLLPESLRNGPGELNTIGNGVLLGCWGLLFLIAGLVLGALFLRKARSSIEVLEKENLKGFNRLEIYRATVEKQSESHIFNG